MRKILFLLGPALLLALVLPWLKPATAAASASNLHVEYLGWTIGSDGSRHQLSYAERVYRDGDLLWIEREIPDAIKKRHEAQAHSALGHTHDDVVGAPLWIRQNTDHSLYVRLVDHHEQRLIEVGPANYGNVGFGGSWAEAYHLLDPADLQKLQQAGPEADGLQTYEAQSGQRHLRVVWDIAGQYAREISSWDEDGLSARTIKATRIDLPKQAPWVTLAAYRLRDYSDLLD